VSTDRSPPRAGKLRADQLLVERGLCESRSRAQALILAGEVLSGTERVEKAGQLLRVDAPLSVRTQERYVSRGGLKLQGALTDLGFSPEGLVAADVGASTGGFTDCLLQHGATRVYAIDVGHGQLAERLRKDARVVSLERTNARHLQAPDVGGGVELVVVDASFIGLDKLLPALFAIALPGAHLLALIKPQFEVGREEARRGGGVVRDDAVRAAAIAAALGAMTAAGFEVLADAPCRVPGPKGNREHFALARRPR
jgi:23S rRNA (cytidine1920-2'-O)/16S rRNA (cytidine1409-2'-O)-methyltransferase